MRKTTRNTINQALNRAEKLDQAWEGASLLLADLEKAGAMPKWVAGHLRDFDERLSSIEQILVDMRRVVAVVDPSLFYPEENMTGVPEGSKIRPPNMPFNNPYKQFPVYPEGETPKTAREDFVNTENWWEEEQEVTKPTEGIRDRNMRRGDGKTEQVETEYCGKECRCR